MRNKTIQIVIFMTAMILIISCNNKKGGNTMKDNLIFEKEVKAANEIFSNTVWVNMLLTDEEYNEATGK